MFGLLHTFARPSRVAQPAPDDGPTAHMDAAEQAEFSPSDPPFLWEPPAPATRRCVESVLLEKGLISPAQLELVRAAAAHSPGRSVGAILVDLKAVGETDVQAALAESLGLAFEQPTAAAVDPAAFTLLDADFMRRHGVACIRFEQGRLVVACLEPSNVFLLDEIARKTSRPVRPVVSTSADIQRLIEQRSGGSAGAAAEQMIREAAKDAAASESSGKPAVAQASGADDDAPIIRFVDYMIHEAIRQGASDIHIEPKEKSLNIRYRIDGLLFETLSPPAAMAATITSRLKIMANLDIAERRMPQDGRIRMALHGRTVDLRLSTLPTPHGEKCVLRILDDRSISVSVDELGFGDDTLTIWKNQIAQPHGIVLVTGPTGSGKTTTLYASLRGMDASRLNISTVEDPIEYELASATQVQVHDKIGMTFSTALRALLRQDPDVVMVGEIRDTETANIAVQAALTGHLVLSTLHTNDAPGTVTRLINIGVEPYLISSAVNAILAQRLVRKICTHCRAPYEPTTDMQEFLSLQGFSPSQCFKGRGCEHCRQTGYSGRLGIYELLVVDDALRDMVTRNPEVNQLRRLCRERGLVTLRDDGFAKVMRGLTTVDEILRVTESAA